MRDQHYYGHGKLLLTGEYFVLEGALALALPTTVGQSMKIHDRSSYSPSLKWKALDHNGKPWFEAEYEFWHFRELSSTDPKVSEDLQKILRQVRLQNPHFLRDDREVTVETKLEFPWDWGLGSSSSLLYNIAQWAYVSPFELAVKAFGGSGYDIACAQSMGPIHYELKDGLPKWRPVGFAPSFRDQLFLVHLGKKRDTREAVQAFKALSSEARRKPVDDISSLTQEITVAAELRHFERALREHEALVASTLNLSPVRTELFSDFWGEVKSLGAWGGDFVLVTSSRDHHETRDYFTAKGLTTVIPYNELISGARTDLGVSAGEASLRAKAPISPRDSAHAP